MMSLVAPCNLLHCPRQIKFFSCAPRLMPGPQRLMPCTPCLLPSTPHPMGAHTMPDALHTTLDAFRSIPHVCTLALTHRQTGGTFWSAGWSGHIRSHFRAAASPAAPSCGHVMARL